MTAVKELLTVFLVFHFCLAKRAAANTNTHHGCERRDKYSEIGYDKGNYVSVNIGVCQTAASKTLYDCLPRNSTEERHLLYHGYFVIKAYTIEACQRVSTTCRRLPHFVLFYPGTAYSRRIDIGVCGGRCRQNKQPCKPVWNKTEGISTPNGIRSIPTIVNCSCVTPHCYRVSNFEAFPEQAFPDANGKTATKTKLVDMGKCVSESFCPGRNRNGFLPVVTRCQADTYKQHAFVSEGGRQVNISAIATCSCHYPRN